MQHEPCRNAGDSETLAEISELVLGYREAKNADIVSRVKYLKTLELGDGEPSPPQTRFDEFDDADHPCRKWWDEHGQYMMSGGGRREFIWACRGWIAREQFGENVKVTGERESGAAQEVSPPSLIPDIRSLTPEESKNLANYYKKIYSKVGVGEVSPPSPEQFYEQEWIGSHGGIITPKPEYWFKFAAAYRKFCGGDTRELKAALRESAYLMSDKGFDELDVEEWDHRAKAIRELAELLG